MDVAVHRSLTVLIALLCLAAVTHTTAAVAQETYVNLTLGNARLSDAGDHEETRGTSGAVGWRWNRFGFETGILQTRDIERRFDVRPIDGGLLTQNFDLRALRFGGTFRHVLPWNWYLSGHVGVALWEVTGGFEACHGGLVAPITCTAGSFERRGNGHYVGVGAGYDFDSHWSVGARWELQQYGLGSDPS